MSRGEFARLGLLSLVLLVVLVVGLPLPPALRDGAQSVAEIFAVDVSMTPVTADMPGLLGRDGERLYDQGMVVLSRTATGVGASIPIEKLDLHRFRIPAVLFCEHQLHGLDVPELRGALCRTLAEELGPLAAFALRLPDSPYSGGEYGFNRWHPCPW